MELDKKKYKYRGFYGIAAFVLDFVNKYIHKVNYEQTRTKLSKLNVIKASEREAYIYVVSKLAISIMVFMAVLIIGYVKVLESNFTEQKEIQALKRPSAGQGAADYQLELQYDGTSENINIEVEAKSYSEEEADQLFDSSYERLVKEFLGDNHDVHHITDHVNLVYELGNDISVDWEIENQDYIDYTGNINWNEIDEGVNTVVAATLTFYDYSRTYDFEIYIDKLGRDKRLKIYDKINEVKNQASMEEDAISLKEVTDEYDARFYTVRRRGSFVYILMAILVSVIIYFVKEKDTDKLLNDRKQQLDMDYAAVISKLTILQSSGMTLLGAWDKMIEDYEKGISNKKFDKQEDTDKKNNYAEEKKIRYVYEEMKYARQNMRKGYSEGAAYLEFGRRCGTHSYIKFANLLEQNIKKGTKGLKEILNQEVREAFEERKAIARKKGDEAGTKLLLPMGMMLIISIVIIIIPALLSFEI